MRRFLPEKTAERYVNVAKAFGKCGKLGAVSNLHSIVIDAKTLYLLSSKSGL
jgi:hypothetical protein